MKKKYIIHIFAPIIFGGLLYVLFRGSNLVMFTWFHKIGIIKIVEATRIFASSFIIYLPSWVLYSLPDALWTYSLTVFMIYNFNQKFDKNSAIWILIGPFISITSELFQLVNIVKGTFDSIDLLLCVIASVLAFLHITRFEKLNLFKYENKYKISD